MSTDILTGSATVAPTIAVLLDTVWTPESFNCDGEQKTVPPAITSWKNDKGAALMKAFDRLKGGAHADFNAAEDIAVLALGHLSEFKDRPELAANIDSSMILPAMNVAINLAEMMENLCCHENGEKFCGDGYENLCSASSDLSMGEVHSRQAAGTLGKYFCLGRTLIEEYEGTILNTLVFIIKRIGTDAEESLVLAVADGLIWLANHQGSDAPGFYGCTKPLRALKKRMQAVNASLWHTAEAKIARAILDRTIFNPPDFKDGTTVQGGALASLAFSWGATIRREELGDIALALSDLPYEHAQYSALNLMDSVLWHLKRERRIDEYNYLAACTQHDKEKCKLLGDYCPITLPNKYDHETRDYITGEEKLSLEEEGIGDEDSD